jgi:cytochrome P450 PksS
MTAAVRLHVDIATPAFKREPHTVFAHLRKYAPVARVRSGQDGDVFLVTRYEDVSALLKDTRFSKDPANALSPAELSRLRRPPAFFAPLQRNMLALDDPDHARLKRLVLSAFTPRRVEMLADRTRAVSARLLDIAETRRRFDVIAAYARPLPVTVISELLGVPARQQRRFARWSNALIRAAASPVSGLLALPEIAAFMRYLRRLIVLKRDVPADDLVSDLVLASDEGDRLDEQELLAMVAILLNAGHETTQNLIGNGMIALLQNNEEAARLRDDPGLAPWAVEELLRFAGPVQTSTARYTREPILVAGVEIPRGSLVYGAINSANRDERQFTDASRLDLSRDPNRHLTFGEGGHYCVGAALARMEARIAFVDLLQRFPHMALAAAEGSLRWNRGSVLRGVAALPVTV